MDVQNNNITIQIHAKNLQGKHLRVNECDVFILHVFTDNPSFYLSFSGRDMIATEHVDEITIPKKQMEQLRSGVVQYTYHYLPKIETSNINEDEVECKHFHKHHHHSHRPSDVIDDELINSKPVVTSIYWRNLILKPNNYPANSANMNDIERLHRMIDVEVNNRIKDVETLNKGLDDEIARSVAEDAKLYELIESLQSKTDEVIGDGDKNTEEVDNKIDDVVKNITELDVKIKQEETARIGADEILSIQLQMEKERAQANEQNLTDRISSVSEKFESFRTIQTDALASEITRAKESEKGLNSLIQNVSDNLNAEISRAAQKDIEHQNLVETESNRAQAVENKIATELETEVNRAKDAEKHLLDEVHGLTDTFSTLASITNVYTKTEIDNKVNGVKNDVDTINNWINNHNNDVDSLNVKVVKLVSDTEKLTSDLTIETTARVNADTILQTKVDTIEGKVDAEVERAKANEKLISDEIADIKSTVTSKHSELTDVIADVDAKITVEIARAKASEKVSSDAIAIINGDVETNGSIKKSLADAKEYTDAEITKLSLAKDTEIADTLKTYATKNDVDKKISDVIGTAPEALDTLGKISNVLSQDSDAITAINGVLSGKVNTDDVYVKSEIDSVITSVNNAIASEENNRTTADTTINGRIDDLIAKINTNEASINTAISDVDDVLNTEIARAKAEEKKISDMVDSELAKVDTKYNELNAKVIQDIADSTAKDVELEAKINANTDNIASEIARAKQVEKELNDKINTIQPPTIDFSEVNDSISALSDKIDDEVLRAKAAEKELNNKIDSIEIPTVDFTEVNNTISNLDTKVDNSVSLLQTAIDDESQTARAAEKANADNIATLQTSVIELTDSVASANAVITQLQADSSELENRINAEKNRAENAEKELADKIDIINGDNETVGSIAYTVEGVKKDIDDKLSDFYTKDEVDKAIEAIELGSDAEIDLTDYYTKTEVDNKFDSIEIPSTVDLSDYATKEYVDEKFASIEIPSLDTIESDITSINTALGDKANKSEIPSIAGLASEHYVKNEISKIQIPDTSTFAKTTNVYTKTEVDNKFANFVHTYLLGDYDSLTPSQKNNGIAIII